LLHGLLAYSRIGSNDGRFEITNLGAVLDAAVDELKDAIANTAAVLSRVPLPAVLGDRAELVELFKQLLQNALKFQGAEPPEIHVGAEVQDENWLISVRDNGIGLEPQYTERIFGVFQRLHPRGRYPGAGIGLAICKKIVEHHGGRIWVASELGRGATFFLTLPAQKGHEHGDKGR
jgi:two-component system, chemotaxis family, sensor kinase Cph1